MDVSRITFKRLGVFLGLLLLVSNAFYYGGQLFLNDHSSDIATTVNHISKVELPQWLTYQSAHVHKKNVFDKFQPESIKNNEPSPVDIPISVESKVTENKEIESVLSDEKIEVLAINFNDNYASCMLRVLGQIVVVGEGDIVDDRYKISRISADAVYAIQL